MIRLYLFLSGAARAGRDHQLRPGERVFVSAREDEELQRLRAFERRVHRIKDLPPEIAEAIQGAKMNPAHDHLNSLLDESQK
jgi:hypothetical protein